MKGCEHLVSCLRTNSVLVDYISLYRLSFASEYREITNVDQYGRGCKAQLDVEGACAANRGQGRI